MADNNSVDLTNFTKMVKDATAAVKELRLVMGQVTASTTGSGGMASSLGRISSGIGAGISAGNSMMPQLQDIVQRSTGFYNANLMQGNRFTQGQMYNNMRAGLGRFGIQDPMATQQLAQFYGTRGVVMGSAYGNDLTSAVGGAVKYLNMNTTSAAAALEGFTNGRGSANLLRNFGIYTANPQTGAVATQQQIFEQIHSRISNGRTQTVAGTQESYRRGALGYFLSNSGMSPDQQQMYYMWELAKAGGVKMDLSNPKSMQAAMQQLKTKNPQLALNEIAASQENVLQQGTSSYLTGLNASVGPIQALNTVAGQLAESFGALKGLVDSIASTGAGGGLGGMVGDLAQGAGMMLGAKMFNGGKGGGTPPVAAGQKPTPTGSAYFAKGAPKGPAAVNAQMTRTKVPGVVKGAGALGAAMTVGNTVSNIAAGAPMGKSIGEGIGSIAGMLIGGVIGTVIGPEGTILGGMVGGTIGSTLGSLAGGAIGGLFDNGGGMGKGGKSPEPSSMNPDTIDRKAAHSAAQWHRPAVGTISSGFGHRKAEFAGMSTFHDGVDIANKAGTRIDAAATGRVIYTQRSASGLGNYVRIYHPQFKMTSGYGHMSSFTVKKGDNVMGGQQIGRMGMTGSATGPHVHVNMTKGKGGSNWIDPSTIHGLGLGASGHGGPSVSNGPGGGSKPNVMAATSPSGFGIPSSSMFSGGSSSLGTGNYGIDEVDYLAGASNGSNIYGNSTTSLLYTPGAKSVNGSNNADGKGGESTVTPLSSMGSNSKFEYNSENSYSIKNNTKSSETPNVTINLTVAKATDAEARKFAQKVKSILENDSAISTIGKK
jgi:hypothetical protein